jgi:glycosyltransferase involved in cell wall biosynthesis
MRASKRPRVCIVRQQDVYEPPVQRAAEALVGAGFDVEVLCMRHEERPAETVVNGVRITSLPTDLNRSNRLAYALGYLSFFLLVAWTLARRHLRRRYVAVQVNTMPDFLVFAALVPKLLGARVFLFLNEPTPELAETIFGPGLISRTLALVEQASMRFADHAFTVTEQLRQRHIERGARGDRITVVLNGADPRVRFGDWTPARVEPDGLFRVICHGSILDRYGQDTLIEAAALLRDELPDLRVIIPGRGKDADAMEARSRELGLADIVDFPGWVSHNEINDLLHRSDIGVVAQKGSPYSHLVSTNKMVDFWLFGLPAVASRLRAVSETYGDDALEYYEPGDAADLARAIRRLHDDPARCAQLVANGRVAQERMGWGAQKGIYLAPYLDVVRPRGLRLGDEQLSVQPG